MPPKGTPRAPVRKPSTTNAATLATGASNAKDKPKEKDSKDTAMPPPPDPTPPKPQGILEPEATALVDCLKSATVTTGQIFRFYSDAKRLGIQRFAPNPPRTLTSSLAYDLGKYDQICDSLESQISRAIAVLQRDLSREETRLREEEEEKARAKAAEPKPSADVEMTQAGPSMDPKKAQFTPPGPGVVPLTQQLRRQSKISLSTLHRNPFPLKLDLSAAALRLNMDEAAASAMAGMSGLGGMSTLGGMTGMGMPALPSPVTLAPRSARPLAQGELPPDLIAALASAAAAGGGGHQHVDIDLTLEDPVQVSSGMMGVDVDKALGSSADKPIELDLDLDVQMSDLFGDRSADEQTRGQQEGADMDSLFSPATASGQPTMDMLNALSAGNNQQHDEDLFASISAEVHASNGLGPPQDGSVAPAPSPSAILADLASSQDETAKLQADVAAATSGETGSADTAASFDYGQLGMGDMGDMGDMPSNLDPFFNASNQDMEMMEQFLGMGGSGSGADAEGTGGETAAST